MSHSKSSDYLHKEFLCPVIELTFHQIPEAFNAIFHTLANLRAVGSPTANFSMNYAGQAKGHAFGVNFIKHTDPNLQKIINSRIQSFLVLLRRHKGRQEQDTQNKISKEQNYALSMRKKYHSCNNNQTGYYDRSSITSDGSSSFCISDTPFCNITDDNANISTMSNSECNSDKISFHSTNKYSDIDVSNILPYSEIPLSSSLRFPQGAYLVYIKVQFWSACSSKWPFGFTGATNQIPFETWNIPVIVTGTPTGKAFDAHTSLIGHSETSDAACLCYDAQNGKHTCCSPIGDSNSNHLSLYLNSKTVDTSANLSMTSSSVTKKNNLISYGLGAHYIAEYNTSEKNVMQNDFQQSYPMRTHSLHNYPVSSNETINEPVSISERAKELRQLARDGFHRISYSTSPTFSIINDRNRGRLTNLNTDSKSFSYKSFINPVSASSNCMSMKLNELDQINVSHFPTYSNNFNEIPFEQEGSTIKEQLSNILSTIIKKCGLCFDHLPPPPVDFPFYRFNITYKLCENDTLNETKHLNFNRACNLTDTTLCQYPMMDNSKILNENFLYNNTATGRTAISGLWRTLPDILHNPIIRNIPFMI